MKKLLLGLFLSAISIDAIAGTCTSISRTNLSANSILTSTEYNNSLNTVYSAANNLDAGCLTDGTLEDGALNTTDFAAVLNGVREGCKLTNTDSNTVSVDRCMLAVNGAFVRTSSATTATWGCSGCSSESASTEYYVYAKSGSIATTLTLLISTTAPNGDGYDASSNRVIGRFFNNSSSAITAVEQWSNGSFVAPRSWVKVYQGAGHGSTNTKIRIFAGIEQNIGTAITRATSAANGDSFTINEDGMYAMHYTDLRSGGASKFGISVDSAALTTDIDALTRTTRINICQAATGTYTTCSAVRYLAANSVVRPHDAGNSDDVTDVSAFEIMKISP